jgi:hypothetical protein
MKGGLGSSCRRGVACESPQRWLALGPRVAAYHPLGPFGVERNHPLKGGTATPGPRGLL